MKSLILALIIFFAGCSLTPEQRAAVGYGLASSGYNWQQTQQNLLLQNAYWQNYRYQQNQLMLMQQQNMILQQQRCP